MKKYIFIFLMLFFLCTPTTTISASDNTAFTTTRLNKVGSVLVEAGQTFGFNLSDLIIPFFTKDKEIAIPDFEPANEFTFKINQRIFPQAFIDQKKVNHWTNSIILKSLYGAILKTDAEYSDHPPPSDCYISTGLQKSTDVPYAASLFENVETIDALWGLMPKNPNENGVLDFNRIDMPLASMNPGADCKRHDEGIELPPVPNNLTSLSTFGSGTPWIIGTIQQTVTQLVMIIINKIETWIEQTITEGTQDGVILTEKKREPWFEMLCHVLKCPGNELGDATEGLDLKGGVANAFLSPEFQKPVIAAGVHPIEVSVLGFKQRPLETSYDNENQADWGLGLIGCAASPDSLQSKLSVGKTRPISPKCGPPVETSTCTPDTWDQITAGLSGAINKAAAKYAEFFPISQGQLSALLKIIFDMEMGLDTEHNGANYACEDNGSSAFGPFQIKSETYEDVTNNCSGEFIEDDIKQCNDEGLSRCMVEDAAELAARVLLLSGGRWVYTPNTCENREVKLSSMSELYTAVCNYGEGDTLLPHLGNKTYCQYAFEQLGWSIP